MGNVRIALSLFAMLAALTSFADGAAAAAPKTAASKAVVAAQKMIPLLTCRDSGQLNDDGSVIVPASESSASVSEDGKQISFKYKSQEIAQNIDAKVLQVGHTGCEEMLTLSTNEVYYLHLEGDRTVMLSPVNNVSPWFQVLDRSFNSIMVSYYCSYNQEALDILRGGETPF